MRWGVYDKYEIEYLRRICDIQERCLNGEIDREECSQKQEIERLKYIAYLSERSQALAVTINNEKTTQDILRKMRNEVID